METEPTAANIWDSVKEGSTTGKEMTLADWGITPGNFPLQAPPISTPQATSYDSAYGSATYNSADPAAGFNGNAFAQPNGMMQNGYAADPNAYYANSYAMGNNVYNMYNGGLYNSSPYNGLYEGMAAGHYDPYYQTQPAPGQQQLALYQAMLQQEAIRREVEAEAEQEKADEELRKKAEDEAKSPLKNDAKWSMNQLMPVHVSSPLGKTLFSCAKTLSPFCTPKGPHRGVGQPLEVRSWLDHPFYFGGFTGWISGSELVGGLIDQKSGAMGGLILGYNISEYWGLESRVHFASIDIQETEKGRQEYENSYMEAFPEATFVPSLPTRSNRLSVFDVSVHYYPLGNAKWRPFFKYGLGLARESFTTPNGQKYREDTMTMPLGIGLRYWWNEHLAIQGDLIDNVVFSSGMTKTQNNWAFCVGLTYSFGTSKKKRPTAYWPYTPSHGSRYGGSKW